MQENGGIGRVGRYAPAHVAAGPGRALPKNCPPRSKCSGAGLGSRIGFCHELPGCQGFEGSTHSSPGTLPYVTRGAVADAPCLFAVTMQEYDVEVVAFILERGVAVGLALDGDKTKRCSHGKIHTDADLYRLQVMTFPADVVPLFCVYLEAHRQGEDVGLICSTYSNNLRTAGNVGKDMQNESCLGFEANGVDDCCLSEFFQATMKLVHQIQ